jgi:Kef-type K+ transport system membrane component KefB
LLSETEYRHQIEIDLMPVKGLLIGLFFVSVGMTLDVQVVWSRFSVVVAMVVILLGIKAVMLFAACRMFR